VQKQSVLMASLMELQEAYLHAQRNHASDELFWRAQYIERLVMVCDGIEDRAGVGGAYRHEQERG
jgi:hypothetical protein